MEVNDCLNISALEWAALDEVLLNNRNIPSIALYDNVETDSREANDSSADEDIALDRRVENLNSRHVEIHRMDPVNGSTEHVKRKARTHHHKEEILHAIFGFNSMHVGEDYVIIHPNRRSRPRTTLFRVKTL